MGRINAVSAAPQKTWTQWRKTWQDLKKNAKARNSILRQLATGTSGGSVCNTILTDSEQDIHNNLIVSTVVEGNNEVSESTTVFQFDEQEQELPQLELQGEQDHGIANDVDFIEIETLKLQRSVETSKPTFNKEVSKGSSRCSQKRRLHTEENNSRMTKAKRLEKSLALTKDLVALSKEKKENLESYYEEKLKLMKIKIEEKKKYHEQKLFILKE